MSVESSTYYYNPFSVVDLECVEDAIIPQVDMDKIRSILGQTSSCHIQLVGKKGRGKTTHLKWISNHFPEYPIHFLNAKSDTSRLISLPSDVIFIDSIHHMSFLQRLALFKAKKNVIFTTHVSRKLECALSKKSMHSIPCRGIDRDSLKSLLNRRLELASKGRIGEHDVFTDEQVDGLMKKYKDDYRAMIYHLYDKFQL